VFNSRQSLLEYSGLTVWRPATEDDLRDASEFEVGDALLCLTAEGKQLVATAGQE
jgi:hypothetical protein